METVVKVFFSLSKFNASVTSKFIEGSFFSRYKVSRSSRSPFPSPQSTTGSLVEGLPGDGGASDHIHLHVRGLFGTHPFGLSILVRPTKHKESRGRGKEGKERGISRGKGRRERARACLLFIRRFSLRSIRVHGPWIRRRPVTPALSDRPHCFNLPPKHRRRHRSLPSPLTPLSRSLSSRFSLLCSRAMNLYARALAILPSSSWPSSPSTWDEATTSSSCEMLSGCGGF